MHGLACRIGESLSGLQDPLGVVLEVQRTSARVSKMLVLRTKEGINIDRGGNPNRDVAPKEDRKGGGPRRETEETRVSTHPHAMRDVLHLD
jgi:hypothetical protein